MKTEYRESFGRDLRAVRDGKVLSALKSVIESVEKADSSSDILNVKKMHGSRGYYRIRVGEFRIGIKIEAETVTFVRFLNRKEIYRFFP